MMSALPVAVIVNGAVVSSAFPAEVDGNRVVAPVAIVARFADRVAYDPAAATVTVERAGRRIVVPVVFIETGEPYVVLAPVVRGIGGTVSFDTAAKVLAIGIGAEHGIATPLPPSAPSDAGVPEILASPVATPTPRVVEAGIPHPRRTPIPVTPSQPGPPP